MPKPFPIRIEVEESFLGVVLRKLNDLEGVAAIDLNFDHLKKPQAEATAGGVANGHGSLEQAVLALLLEGPKSARDISQAIGGKTSRAHGALHGLKKKGLAKGIGGGLHQATPKATAALGKQPTALLPAPTPPPGKSKGKRKTTSRAGTGSGRAALLDALATAPARPIDLSEKLEAAGLSAKSISGVFERARRDGLVKKDAEGLYDLTAKGRKAHDAAGKPAEGEAHG